MSTGVTDSGLVRETKPLRLLKGYTLVEMMVTVAIIGLLAGLAIPNIMRSREKAAKEQCISNLTTIYKAKQNWAMDKKKLTTSIPPESELFGSGQYITEKPRCTSGGTYTIRNVEQAPLCNIPGHAL